MGAHKIMFAHTGKEHVCVVNEKLSHNLRNIITNNKHVQINTRVHYTVSTHMGKEHMCAL